MRPPIDVATRVSAELSAFIETMVNDPDREEPPKLQDVRVALEERGVAEAEEVDMHPQDRTSMLAEIESLIDEYGGDTLAVAFFAAKASESLSRIIEAAMDDASLPEEPTLGAVREAMVSGLTARLVGDGMIDPDEDGTLLEEIDELIRRYGTEQVAETFIRFE